MAADLFSAPTTLMSPECAHAHNIYYRRPIIFQNLFRAERVWFLSSNVEQTLDIKCAPKLFAATQTVIGSALYVLG